MILADSRKRTIITIIEECLKYESVQSKPDLVACFLENGAFPFDFIVNLPKLLKMNVSQNELLHALKKDKVMSEWIRQGSNGWVLAVPYRIEQHVLLIDNTELKVSVEDISEIVMSLTGATNNSVSSEGELIKILFTDVSSLISFWRALSYVYINGKSISARAQVIDCRSSCNNGHDRDSVKSINSDSNGDKLCLNNEIITPKLRIQIRKRVNNVSQ